MVLRLHHLARLCGLVLLFVSCRDHEGSAAKQPLQAKGEATEAKASTTTSSETDTEVSPSRRPIAPDARPVLIGFGDASFCAVAQPVVAKNAHFLCLARPEPENVRSRLLELKKSAGEKLHRPPVALVSADSLLNQGVFQLVSQDPNFFSYLFLLDSTDLVVTSTLLHSLRDRGLKQLGLSHKIKKSHHIKSLAKRQGLRLDLLQADESAKPYEPAMREVLQLLAQSDARFQSPPAPESSD